MDGSERIKIGSAGVFDVELLQLPRRDYANMPDFSFQSFMKKTAEWGGLKPRPKIEYSMSPQIKIEEYTGSLRDFSVCKVLNDGMKKSLQEIVRAYILDLDSYGKNMFCIHSKERPHCYYDKTIAHFVHQSVFRPRKHFPIVVIVTDSEHSRRTATNALFYSRQKITTRGRGCRGLIRELGNGLENELTAHLQENGKRPTTDILVGTSSEVSDYIEKLKANVGDIEDLQMTVKYVVVVGAEVISTDEQFHKEVKGIADCLKTNSAFIFFHDFIDSKMSLPEAVKTCRSMVSREMFVEVERQSVEKIFERINFLRTVSKAEFANRMIAELMRDGKDVEDDCYERFTAQSTAQLQKVRLTIDCIHHLRKEREDINKVRKQFRRERILIITKNKEMALFVYWHLQTHAAELNKNDDRRRKIFFNVDKLIEIDSIEHVERINLEFRWSELDVLVIDWSSIQSVNRGTVDAVILYDSPEQAYFQTMIETEMANLTSYRSPVKIKLYVLFDVDEDVKLMGQYVRLLQKYGKGAPDWFVDYYQIYRAQWYERHAGTAVSSSTTSSYEVIDRNVQ